MCKYCEKDGYYNRNKSLISKTLKNNVDIDLSINVKDKKLVASIENLKIRVEDDNWFLTTKKINYCPLCRKEARRVKLENFKKTKIFINTKKIQTRDLLRIVKSDGKVFDGIVLFNTGFKYYNKTNEEFRDIMLNETDASDIESIEILNR